MTLLAYRPDLAIALADELLARGLSEDARQKLTRIHEQTIALVTPLAQVRSLTEADNLTSLATSDYIALAASRVGLRSDVDVLREGTNVVSPLIESVRESSLMSEEIKEQWYGALESFAAYVDWFWTNYADAADEDRQSAVTAMVQHTQRHMARAGMAFDALVLILNSTLGSTPDALPILAELADRCWTEVEDYFLSLAEYDDKGGTVPLSEVKTELGL